MGVLGPIVTPTVLIKVGFRAFELVLLKNLPFLRRYLNRPVFRGRLGIGIGCQTFSEQKSVVNFGIGSA